jgi:formylglycine-generating enzyme required for sulfatase activity
MTLVLNIIPAGEFLMGRDKAKDKAAYDDELPQHKRYCEKNALRDVKKFGNHPVNNVS